MSMQGPKTKDIFQKALKVIPHGVNSNFRYWGDDDTVVVSRGKGAYIWDMDGKRYIDYRLAFGPIILGHAEPRVTQRVQEAIEIVNLLAGEESLQTTGEVQDALGKIDKRSVADPEDLWALSRDIPYSVNISWLDPDEAGSYDVAFMRAGKGQTSSHLFTSFPGETAFLGGIIS